MFIGQKTSWAQQKHFLPLPLVAAFEETMASINPSKGPGRYDLGLISGSFFLLQDIKTRPFEETKLENHRDYIDVQYLIQGVERLGFAQFDSSMTPLVEAYDEKNIAFFSAPPREAFVDLVDDQFIVFFPGELHRPLLSASEDAMVRKCVIKVPIKAIFSAA